MVEKKEASKEAAPEGLGIERTTLYRNLAKKREEVKKVKDNVGRRDKKRLSGSS